MTFFAAALTLLLLDSLAPDSLELGSASAWLCETAVQESRSVLLAAETLYQPNRNQHI